MSLCSLSSTPPSFTHPRSGAHSVTCKQVLLTQCKLRPKTENNGKIKISPKLPGKVQAARRDDRRVRDDVVDRLLMLSTGDSQRIHCKQVATECSVRA